MTLRRNLSHLLVVWAVRVDPDPPFTITTTRRIDQDYPDFDGLVIEDMGGGLPAVSR